MKIKKFFDVVHFYKEQKASYEVFMVDNEANH